MPAILSVVKCIIAKESAARSLIYAIRRMGARIYLEIHDGVTMVCVDTQDAFHKGPTAVQVPRRMLDRIPKLKAALIAFLSRPSDPEAQANALAWSEWKLITVRAVKMEGRR